MPNREAELDRLERILNNPAGPRGLVVPQGGWLASVRHGLAILQADLAKKIDATPSQISAFERGEREKTISLGNLERVATALGCQFVYALVPLGKGQRFSEIPVGSDVPAQGPAAQAAAPTANPIPPAKSKADIPPIEDWEDLLAPLAKKYHFARMEIPGPNSKMEIPTRRPVEVMVSYKPGFHPPADGADRIAFQKAAAKILHVELSVLSRTIVESLKPGEYDAAAGYLIGPMEFAIWWEAEYRK